jgi:hypothetical protein
MAAKDILEFERRIYGDFMPIPLTTVKKAIHDRSEVERSCMALQYHWDPTPQTAPHMIAQCTVNIHALGLLPYCVSD